ncbi:hypothetical protein BDZ91DRAFT_798725 [Kalaharituber pfeilii]|nr:hypothetical protein BDZ91DRAFT_798725 [Kalaharituber pfeilii]
MSSDVASPISSVEDRVLPGVSEQLELYNDTPTYPNDWPLPNTPFPEQNPEQEATVAGVKTPPLQLGAQRSPPMSTATRLSRSSTTTSVSSPHRKRLSLSFPVQPARHVPSAFASPNTPTSPVELGQPDPSDPSAFLTALAAQERRVLELREELTRAESELTKLKRQWAFHEATRKRHELLQIEVRGGSDENTGEGYRITSPTLDEQQARRKAALAKLTQASTRSVTSQRHHRTLSLLSPQRNSYAQPSAQTHDGREDVAESNACTSPGNGLKRADTLPPPSTRPLSMIETSSIKRNSQDLLFRTGKQMAEGFKEGLWAFVEDLRQATVGEDFRYTTSSTSRYGSSLVTSSQGVRKQGSKNSLRSVSSSSGKREKSPVKADFDSARGDSRQSSRGSSSQDDISTTTRWSTSSTLSDIGQSSSLIHSRSSTPRTSTSSVLSSSSGQVLQGLQLPLWGPVMSASTQFDLKKTAAMVLNHVEKTLVTHLVSDVVTSDREHVKQDGVLRRRSVKGEHKSKRA